MEKKIVKYKKEELKKMKGGTHWAKLIQEEKSHNKKSSRRKKRAADFCVRPSQESASR